MIVHICRIFRFNSTQLGYKITKSNAILQEIEGDLLFGVQYLRIFVAFNLKTNIKSDDFASIIIVF